MDYIKPQYYLGIDYMITMPYHNTNHWIFDGPSQILLSGSLKHIFPPGIRLLFIHAQHLFVFTLCHWWPKHRQVLRQKPAVDLLMGKGLKNSSKRHHRTKYPTCSTEFDHDSPSWISLWRWNHQKTCSSLPVIWQQDIVCPCNKTELPKTLHI